MTDSATLRWHGKAAALHEAWVDVWAMIPPPAALALGLAVAQHETRCGDAWPGEHNWGAVQKRPLSAAERAIIADAGISFPVRSNELLVQASALLRGAAAAGKINPIRDEALHFDSSPVTGLYVVWFHAFPNDVEGAKKFVHELARRPKCRAVLEGPAPTPLALARAMYEEKYYEGFYDPATPEGRQKNIDAYATSLRAYLPAIERALESWVAPAVDLPDATRQLLNTVRGQKWALNYLGYGRPKLPENETQDRRFWAVVGFFQGANTDTSGVDLVVDGSCGAKTVAALYEAIITFEKMKPQPKGGVD